MADEKGQLLWRLRAQGLRPAPVSREAHREQYDRATTEGWDEGRTREELPALLGSTLDGSGDEPDEPAE